MKTTIICMLLLIASVAWGDIIYVPSGYPTIQDGIDVAVDGDTVLVAYGTYTGEDNRDLDFRGKAIAVTSEDGAEYCIIECEGNGRGFYFHSGEGEASVVSGFTIRNGSKSYGGGIYCENSSPTIMNNIIVGNRASDSPGGGIYCTNSSPIIANNIIEKNQARSYGGGVYCSRSSALITDNIIRENQASDEDGGGIYCGSYPSPTIANNIIIGNQSGDCGGGIYCSSTSPHIINNLIVENQVEEYGGGILCSASHPAIANNTIVGNIADNYGGGVVCFSSSDPTITNTILWNDKPNEIYLDSGGLITVIYSDVQRGWEGEGNIDADPLFVDPDNDDYHLTDYSPCIGAGMITPDVPDTDIEGNPRPNPFCSRPDIGAYENPLEEPLPITGSINGHVMDRETGKPIIKALMLAVQGENHIITTTDRFGYYEIEELQMGIWWVLCIKKTGYKSCIRKVEVKSGEETTVNFRLRPKQ